MKGSDDFDPSTGTRGNEIPTETEKDMTEAPGHVISPATGPFLIYLNLNTVLDCTTRYRPYANS